MTSILTPLQKTIAKAFKGKLLVGTIQRVSSGGVNEYGDPITGPSQEFRCEGFVDNYDDVYRRAAGIPETSVKIILIAGNTAISPQKTDRITFAGIEYEVLKIKTDPAIAHYECESYRVN